MKKVLGLALLVLALCPLIVAAEAEPASTPAPEAAVAPQAAPAVADAVPQPIFLATCQQLCASEYSSCKLDCRFSPYPGCTNDCFQEYQACLAGC